jgi:hypothetical protein
MNKKNDASTASKRVRASPGMLLITASNTTAHSVAEGSSCHFSSKEWSVLTAWKRKMCSFSFFKAVRNVRNRAFGVRKDSFHTIYSVFRGPKKGGAQRNRVFCAESTVFEPFTDFSDAIKREA